jgi:Tol biopolymer transport system component
LRIVAGDGTGDHLLAVHARGAPPAWDPLRLHTVAYYSSGAIELRNADTGHLVWRTRVAAPPTDLGWSTDGRYLAVTSAHKVTVLTRQGRVHHTVTTLAQRFIGAAFQPRTHELALSIRTETGSAVGLVDADRPGHGKTLFAGPGSFGDSVWSPDGRWLLLAWPTADQWLFLHGSRVRAVGNIKEQFPRDDDQPPRLEFDQRWCCAS